MTDIHSHILPGVDDGAENLAQTEEMLASAKRAGITSIIATPHLRARASATGQIKAAYLEAKPMFEHSCVELRLGYECHYGLLVSGLDLRPLTIETTNVLLLEFSPGYLPMHWENSIVGLQRDGIEIIIAHPERYASIQQDIGIAERMVEVGCEMQVSAGSLHRRVFASEKKCALSLLEKGLVSYIASDAHVASDYDIFARINKKYGHLITKGALLREEERRA